MSKQIKLRCCLLFMDLNHLIAEVVLFHWLNLAVLMILLLVLSRILLLILPISDLVGLISRQVGLLAKFGLWSLRVMNASLLAVLSTLSPIPVSLRCFCFLRGLLGRCQVVLYVGLGDVLFEKVVVCGWF